MEGNKNYLKDRREKFTNKLNEQKNAELLQEYPVKIYPGCGANKVRIRRKPTVRKFNFESKI